MVFIDDIDRLDRSEIHAIVRLVKLTAGFDYTTYVLAFDDEVVAAALAERYPGGSERDAGQNFLEKIIQVPLRLPPAHPDALLSLTLEHIGAALHQAATDLTERQKNEFRRYFDPAFLARVRTPRLGKRYANGLAFGLPLVRGEVSVGDFLLIEAVRVIYPKVYKSVRSNRDLFLGQPSLTKARGRI